MQLEPYMIRTTRRNKYVLCFRIDFERLGSVQYSNVPAYEAVNFRGWVETHLHTTYDNLYSQWLKMAPNVHMTTLDLTFQTKEECRRFWSRYGYKFCENKIVDGPGTPNWVSYADRADSMIDYLHGRGYNVYVDWRKGLDIPLKCGNNAIGATVVLIHDRKHLIANMSFCSEKDIWDLDKGVYHALKPLYKHVKSQSMVFNGSLPIEDKYSIIMHDLKLIFSIDDEKTIKITPISYDFGWQLRIESYEYIGNSKYAIGEMII